MTKTCEPITIRIYCSGPVEKIKDACRAFCYENGLCVTVTPTTFIYTGGEESGAVVTMENYPRFPKTLDEMSTTAVLLATAIRNTAWQDSVMIVAPDKTTWITNRTE